MDKIEIEIPSNVQTNPAVTFAMSITEVLPIRLLIPNIIAQLIAAVFATMTAQIIRQDLRQGLHESFALTQNKIIERTKVAYIGYFRFNGYFWDVIFYFKTDMFHAKSL